MDDKLFRRACGQFLTGITIVTTCGPDGQPVGLTANSFTSVSLTPPLLLVCIDERIRSFPAFQQATAYAVHVLGRSQRALSDRFASKEPDKFAGLAWQPGLDGTPLLPDFLARFECRVVHNYRGGDHIILVGEVQDLFIREADEAPLGFFAGKYVSIAP